MSRYNQTLSKSVDPVSGGISAFPSEMPTKIDLSAIKVMSISVDFHIYSRFMDVIKKVLGFLYVNDDYCAMYSQSR